MIRSLSVCLSRRAIISMLASPQQAMLTKRVFKMKILYTSAQVKKTIAQLFSSSKGRRVAITAFVGNGAEVYLSKPKGIELICWPKAGGTNPNAIWELKRRRGVTVFFADSLHMKLYWTEDKGAVVTSANLSTSALGAGGLKEIGVFVPRGKINIDRVLESVKYRPASDYEISKLEIAHKDYWKRNPASAVRTSKAKTFPQWHEISKPSWKLSPMFYVDNIRLSANAKAILEEEHGVAKYYNLTNLTKMEGEYFRENDWLLTFNQERESKSPIFWTFVHHKVKVSPSDKKSYDREWPFQIIQVSSLRAYEQPPFQIDKCFKRAFRTAIREYGGVQKIEDAKSRRPSIKLLELIFKNYK